MHSFLADTFDHPSPLSEKLEKNAFKLLVVEDQELDAMLLTNALRSVDDSIVITVINQGEKCIELLQQLFSENKPLPNLVLLDLFLEGNLHGTQVLAKIKADIRFKYLPVIVWTSSLSEEYLKICAETQASNYIHKPQSWEQFQELAKFLVHHMKGIAELPPVWTFNAMPIDNEAPKLSEAEISKVVMKKTMSNLREVVATDYRDWPNWQVLMFLSFRVRECLMALDHLLQARESKDGLWSNLKFEAPYLENEVSKLAENLRAICANVSNVAVCLDLSSGNIQVKFTQFFNELNSVLNELTRLFYEERKTFHQALEQPQAVD